MSGAGWTAEEYATCPEVINRLHRRILDLQDALDMALYHGDNLERVINHKPVRDLSESRAGFNRAKSVWKDSE